jgi:5-methylcytosine-specific restriction protein A
MAMRKRRTPQQREAICVAHDWICCICAGKIDPVREKWILEHKLALAAGGADDDTNLAPAHYRCAIEKTKDDVKTIAKINRVRAKHLGTKTKSQRGFKGWRKFSGEIVWRHK